MIQYNEYSIILYSTVNDAQNKDQHLLYCDLISFTIVLSWYTEESPRNIYLIQTDTNKMYKTLTN